MKARRLTRFQIWLDARRDRKYNLPAAGATALSASEQRIQGAVNLSIRSLQDQYAKEAEKLKAALRAAIDQLRQVELPAWDQVVKRTNRFQENVTLGTSAHLALMGVLTIGEACFNVVAFTVSGEATIFSIGMALAVSVAIPTLAFGSGVALRQYEPLRTKILWTSALAVVAIVMLYVINDLRASYLLARRALESGDAPWFATTLAYFAINLGVLVAAALVIYLAKDSDSAFVEAKRRVEARKAQIARAVGRFNELGVRMVHQAEMLRESGRQAIAFYRSHNRLGRKDVPAYFDDERATNHVVEFIQLEAERFDLEAS